MDSPFKTNKEKIKKGLKQIGSYSTRFSGMGFGGMEDIVPACMSGI